MKFLFHNNMIGLIPLSRMNPRVLESSSRSSTELWLFWLIIVVNIVLLLFVESCYQLSTTLLKVFEGISFYPGPDHINNLFAPLFFIPSCSYQLSFDSLNSMLFAKLKLYRLQIAVSFADYDLSGS